MNKNKQVIKKILIGLVIAIIILIGYSFFNSQSSINKNSGGLSSMIGSSSRGQIQETTGVVANAEILRILGSIENIELHDDIFSNPVFRKLKDTNFAIPRPARIGRSNPFLPIGIDTLDLFNNIEVQSNNSEYLLQDNETQNQENDFFSELGNNLN